LATFNPAGGAAGAGTVPALSGAVDEKRRVLERLQRETLLRVRDQMAAHSWSDDEIAELVAPTMGIITGLPDLLAQLDELRRIDFGMTPPASDVPTDG